MKKLLHFLQKLELHKIHYTIEHNRDEYIMVLVAIPGERWEVEFDAEGNIDIEVHYTVTSLHELEELVIKWLPQSISSHHKALKRCSNVH